MGHDGVMSSDLRFFVKAKDPAVAEAWATVLRSLGMEVRPPTDSPVVSGDGTWVVRAQSVEADSNQRGQRQDGCTCTRPQLAS